MCKPHLNFGKSQDIFHEQILKLKSDIEDCTVSFKLVKKHREGGGVRTSVRQIASWSFSPQTTTAVVKRKDTKLRFLTAVKVNRDFFPFILFLSHHHHTDTVKSAAIIFFSFGCISNLNTWVNSYRGKYFINWVWILRGNTFSIV